MPYINEFARDELNLIVMMLLNDPKIMRGHLNYLIHKLVKDYIKMNGENYNTYKEIIGELECAKLEIYRRMVAKYEDKKIEENGDIE